MRRRDRENVFSQIRPSFRSSLSAFKYSKRAVQLVWKTSPILTAIVAFLTGMAGVLPAGIAYLGKLIIDSVVVAAESGTGPQTALMYVGFEAIAVMMLTLCQRGLSVCQSLLRVLLGQTVNELILEKALTLSLSHFEDSEVYDKMTRARREASSRPLSFVNRTFGLVQESLGLVAYSGLLLQFSGWVVVVLAIAAIPPFLAETKFAGAAFRVFKRRSPETREQIYLETLIAREDYAKEVQLYQLGPVFLNRYRNIFHRLYQEDRNLTLRRGFWGYVLGLLSSLAFYGTYAWIAIAAISGSITLGDMTMYLMVFRQGQSSFSATLSAIGGMYEDNLYLSNLYEFLEQEIPQAEGSANRGPIPQDGVRFQNVSFTYPDATQPALSDITFHLKPGEKLALVGKNGSGKTTLIKLLTRLYEPSSGQIFLDGLDLRQWDINHLRQRIGVIFQDFVRYQFLVGENIGVGDVDSLEDETRWKTAAEKGMAEPFIATLPQGFYTQLGRWFKSGTELSGGQWQKIGLSRAFMRIKADILVLDEPTSAMDAEAEFEIFERFRRLAQDRMVLLISHRFSTVRMADTIIVLEAGELIEKGTHEELMQAEGRYAKLFTLQAAGYQ
ncbi:ABC transporter ATP-binding protein [Laspinema olomoucense]|uniref:ABC transporter ATP-binding protein/permease n=1 Tax=Laspinema olomoucense D3b TaxID=2953688 RepID=A0ABT2N2Q2_9CYAN|nr:MULTISPECIES: ABC transporter ATP-binding protein [unclassified Laspinema]MCT7970525.1 ABC transporter ATP-binding protein/permease [Laspinema sp. D3d]MCT7976973.1 ABC transporter ATP-binding protein/permease [Laspinema sp. D3b]MCT7991651.1 ABC transporter ATP-binding protein/permease [Laspinema sp. D3a]